MLTPREKSPLPEAQREGIYSLLDYCTLPVESASTHQLSDRQGFDLHCGRPRGLTRPTHTRDLTKTTSLLWLPLQRPGVVGSILKLAGSALA